MINMILKYAVTSGHIPAGNVYGTDIASKTGTSSLDYKAMGLPSTAIADAWQVAYSPDYAIATWYGYKTNTKEQYLSQNEGWAQRRYITQALTTTIMEKNSTWK
jgi:membrane peptidoglycan carboxypeptidase